LKKWVVSQQAKSQFPSSQLVKPVELMKYLIRLITPPNGVVLDCFAGSGTTGVAAVKERKRFILIEQEADYYNIADARVRYAINTLEPTLFPEVI
jgi:DNA modification methylase